MIAITVSAGTGTVSVDFGHLPCEAVSITAPDSTPMYDFAIYNANGQYVVGAADITAQKAKINESFRLDGICQLSITGAVDDGVYQVEPFQRD